MKLFLMTLQQVGVLTICILIGYFFKRKRLITDEGKTTLAKLLVYFFSPCYTVMSLSTVVNIYDIVEYVSLLAAGVGVAAFGILLANVFGKLVSREKLERNIVIYALAFSNIGYFGYPIVAAIFGEIMRAQMMLFCLPMTICINTYGYYILTTGLSNPSQGKKSMKERLSFLWSPPLLGTYVGVMLGLLSSGVGFAIPNFVMEILQTAGNCQSAVAMLLTGAVLAGVPFGQLFVSWRSYIVGVLRLLVIPVIMGACFLLLNFFGLGGETFRLIFRVSVISTALPVGMNTVVFPEAVGQDGTNGAKTCFISYLLALITMPLIFMLMEFVVTMF